MEQPCRLLDVSRETLRAGPSCAHCDIRVACGIEASTRVGPAFLSVALHSGIGAVIRVVLDNAAYRRFLRASSGIHAEICAHTEPPPGGTEIHRE